jgi:DNA repair protein RecN (Recombination protein N)
MLNFLSIKNFALLEDVLLEFNGGLTALTGETGAGKTIIVEALGLALGDKASGHQVRQGAQRSSVTAGFQDLAPRVQRLLKELDLPAGEELHLRRDVDAGGRSRGFINDHPVSLSTLARMGELLADMHGQHEHQLLLRAAEQRDLLDDFGRHQDERQAVQDAYGLWRDLKSQQEAASLSEQERARRLDLYRYQLEELKAAALKPGEDEECERLLPQLKNAEKLKALAAEAYGNLYGQDASAVDGVRRAARALDGLSALGMDLGDAPALLSESLAGLEEAARRLDALQERVELDPAKLDGLISRMDLMARLKKKYGPALEDVLAYQGKIAEEFDRLENSEERNRDLAGKLAAAEKNLEGRSKELSKARAAAAKKLAEAVGKELGELGLGRAEFSIAVERSPDGAYSAAGFDTIEFLFAPNPGEGRKSLAAVASGGELSRVMLALKTVSAKTDPVGTLVFDEIDAGVGGDLGGAIGRKLARLGRSRQVLCITHLASIAACAATQFFVEKEVKGDRTRTAVRRLSDDERVAEIARMLGGAARDGKNAVSLQHARTLLAEAKA